MAKKIIQKNKKIVVGVSGGIDSAIALYLLKKKGWTPVGVFLELPKWKNKKQNPTLQSAKKVCEKLSIPFYKINVKADFKREVVNYFISEFKNSQTPNPCIICNRYLKFKKLFEFAKKHNVQFVATGHYAKVKYNFKTKKYKLLQPKDKQKDQTYYLSLLPQKWLKNIIFPLESITKKQVYRISEKLELKSIIKEKQSQDFCFVNRKSLPIFLKEKIGEQPGPIINSKEEKLGQHEGLHFYTIGQRRGINLPGGPYFVKELNKETNTLIVAKNKKELLQKELFLSPFHFISNIAPKRKIRVIAKIRYRQKLSPATLFPLKSNKLRIVFDKAQRAVTPGQFCVFYSKNICLGNGVIM